MEVGIGITVFGDLVSIYNKYIPIKAQSSDPFLPLLGLIHNYQLAYKK
jgi:hypothetical protein